MNVEHRGVAADPQTKLNHLDLVCDVV